ncbi:MAG: lytic transglycosylase domain-containing protein [Anaerolineae bacterium]
MTAYGESLGVSYQVLQTPLNFDDEEDYFAPVYLPQQPVDVVNQRMIIILGLVLIMVATAVFTGTHLLQNSEDSTGETAVVAESVTGQGDTAVSPNPPAAVPAEGAISSVFSPQVQHWAPQIAAWAAQYGLDPDIVATIMQIESCGDPQAVSHAGAQGLFQVMPFHFSSGEAMLDPDTNAARGLAYYAERLQQTGGDVFQAFAGYNGGHVAAAGNWNSWPSETQRYYTWSKGIYEDAKSGAAESTTLQQWMQAGGASLCQQASMRLNLN